MGFYEYSPEELEAVPGEKVLLLRRADWFRAQPGLLVLRAITFPGEVRDCSSWAGFIGDVATELISGVWKHRHIGESVHCHSTHIGKLLPGKLQSPQTSDTWHTTGSLSAVTTNSVCLAGSWNSFPAHLTLAVLNAIASVSLIYVTIELTLHKLQSALEHSRLKRKQKAEKER